MVWVHQQIFSLWDFKIVSCFLNCREGKGVFFFFLLVKQIGLFFPPCLFQRDLSKQNPILLFKERKKRRRQICPLSGSVCQQIMPQSFPNLCFGVWLMKSHPPSLPFFSSPSLLSLWCIYTLTILSCSISSPPFALLREASSTRFWASWVFHFSLKGNSGAFLSDPTYPW